MNKTRSILTIVLIILIGILALLSIGWIFGMFPTDIFENQVYKWLGAAGVITVAGLAMALLEDSVSSHKGK